VASRDLAARIGRHASRAGVSLSAGALAALSTYLEVLAKWNRKINLTAFALDKSPEAAIDRLIVEPLVAAKHVRRADLLAIDLGSGGGSPAIPLAIAVPHLRMVLVEVKTRKAVFLREAIRVLSLEDRLEVENRRFEELLSRVELNEAADLVTFRAVRADADLWNCITGLLQPAGRVFWFGGLPGAVVPAFEVVSRESLVSTGGGTLAILTRRGMPAVVA
jgi:16S rRNA (guanine527-N7)-methyltransferase